MKGRAAIECGITDALALPWWARSLSGMPRALLHRIAAGQPMRSVNGNTINTLVRRGLIEAKRPWVLTHRGRQVASGTVPPIPPEHQRCCTRCHMIVDVRDADQLAYLAEHEAQHQAANLGRGPCERP